MSAKTETSIWIAIKSRIDGLSLNYDIAWPGERFTPGAKPYLRLGRVSATPTREFISDGKPHNHTGSIIITLVYPIGPSVSAFDQIGATIAEHFRDGTQMRYGDVCVTVTSYPHMQEG